MDHPHNCDIHAPRPELENTNLHCLVHVQLENWRDAVAVLEKVTHHDPHFAGGMAHEHLLTATNNLRMQSSVRLEAGVFVMFIITIIMLAWMKYSRWQQRSRKSNHKKIKRK